MGAPPYCTGCNTERAHCGLTFLPSPASPTEVQARGAAPAEFVICEQPIEHTLRFCKERLGWDRARVRTPEQMERWTWVVLAAYTQLRLARGLIGDCRLPWERPRPPSHLTPWRVLRGFGELVVVLGTPASAPKPCGRSPGRP